MDSRILHVDFNNFYASVECLSRPELRNKPLAVAGDPERRHGIILAKNDIAKRYGVKTGEAIWQAKQKCPQLCTVAPHFSEYIQMSRLARQVLETYSNRLEPFGLDESWIDITDRTNSGGFFGFSQGERIANEIRMRIKRELGITVSVGLADNKPFAKLGSDYKKPDAVTVFSPDNYAKKVWPLPVEELLFVGKSTAAVLWSMGIATIGDLARADVNCLCSKLGKNGILLHRYANGEDNSPVHCQGYAAAPKSIGNGITTPYDMRNNSDIKLTMTMLSESVAARLREQKVRACTIHICVRDAALCSFTRQRKLKLPTFLANELLEQAMELFVSNYNWAKPVRSVTVSASELISQFKPTQIILGQDEDKRIRQEELAKTVDNIRSRFGHRSIIRGSLLKDERIAGVNPKDEHVIYPCGNRS